MDGKFQYNIYFLTKYLERGLQSANVCNRIIIQLCYKMGLTTDCIMWRTTFVLNYSTYYISMFSSSFRISYDVLLIYFIFCHCS